MAVVGTGAFCLPLENLRTLLANCSAFQTWTGTANATAAKARISLFAENIDTLPTATITWGAQNNYASDKAFGGEGGTYIRGGNADIFFIGDLESTYAAYEDTLDDLMLDFCNGIGAIMDDLDELAGTDAYLDVTGWQKVGGPMRSGKEETEKIVELVVRVSWTGAAV